MKKLANKIDPAEISKAKNELRRIDTLISEELSKNTLKHFSNRPWSSAKPLSEEMIDLVKDLSEEEQSVVNISRAGDIDHSLSLKFLMDSNISNAAKTGYIDSFIPFKVSSGIKDALKAIKDNYENKKLLY